MITDTNQNIIFFFRDDNVVPSICVLSEIIYIRNMGHTITEAIHRQLAHYPYHIGQIVFIGKMICDSNWNSLSIPKGNSQTYNADKFAQPKQKIHFTDEFYKK